MTGWLWLSTSTLRQCRASTSWRLYLCNELKARTRMIGSNAWQRNPGDYRETFLQGHVSLRIRSIL
nr:hypothetical protein Q903MT_gene1947 [Picea sitchensis]